MTEIIELSSTRPLAKVVHTCIICGTPIAIGQHYLRHVIRSNAMLDKKHNLRVFKYHLQCPKSTLPAAGRCPSTAYDASEDCHQRCLHCGDYADECRCDGGMS